MVTGKNAVKVGDKVRTSGPFSADPTTGVVVSLSDGFVKVKIEAGGIWSYKYSEIDLLPVASATGTAESQPAPFTIEAGKYYRTRDGHKVGPVFANDDYYAADGMHYNAAGECGYCGHHNPEDSWRDQHDLIAEWVDEPVASAETANDNTPPVAEQEDNQKLTSNDGRTILEFDAGVLKFKAATLDEPTLLRTKQGYGFEIARYGDYVWVDTGQKAPLVFKAADVQGAA